MAFAPGPRNKASAVAANPLSAAVPWAPNTAVPAGQVLTNAGSSYSANIAFTTPATFNTTNLTLIAGVGAQGNAAPALSFPFTTDATNLTYTITHNLNTRGIKAQVQDPNDSYAEVPGLDYTYPTLNTCVVAFGAAPGVANLVLAVI